MYICITIWNYSYKHTRVCIIVERKTLIIITKRGERRYKKIIKYVLSIKLSIEVAKQMSVSLSFRWNKFEPKFFFFLLTSNISMNSKINCITRHRVLKSLHVWTSHYGIHISCSYNIVLQLSSFLLFYLYHLRGIKCLHKVLYTLDWAIAHYVNNVFQCHVCNICSVCLLLYIRILRQFYAWLAVYFYAKVIQFWQSNKRNLSFLSRIFFFIYILRAITQEICLICLIRRWGEEKR